MALLIEGVVVFDLLLTVFLGGIHGQWSSVLGVLGQLGHLGHCSIARAPRITLLDPRRVEMHGAATGPCALALGPMLQSGNSL